jgi:hypothetical protein
LLNRARENISGKIGVDTDPSKNSHSCTGNNSAKNKFIGNFKDKLAETSQDDQVAGVVGNP